MTDGLVVQTERDRPYRIRPPANRAFADPETDPTPYHRSRLAAPRGSPAPQSAARTPQKTTSKASTLLSDTADEETDRSVPATGHRRRRCMNPHWSIWSSAANHRTILIVENVAIARDTFRLRSG